jgi:hypothetical protein
MKSLALARGNGGASGLRARPRREFKVKGEASEIAARRLGSLSKESECHANGAKDHGGIAGVMRTLKPQHHCGLCPVKDSSTGAAWDQPG